MTSYDRDWSKQSGKYPLWMRTRENLLKFHHGSNCECGENSADSGCYESLTGPFALRHATTFKKAHSVVEDGFRSLAEFRSSVVHEEDHPLNESRLIHFELRRNFSHDFGPAFGNVTFGFDLPLDRVLKGDLRLFQVEMIEYQSVISSRLLLSKEPHGDLYEIEVTKCGGTIYYNETRRKLFLLQRCASTINQAITLLSYFFAILLYHYHQ